MSFCVFFTSLKLFLLVGKGTAESWTSDLLHTRQALWPTRQQHLVLDYFQNTVWLFLSIRTLCITLWVPWTCCSLLHQTHVFEFAHSISRLEDLNYLTQSKQLFTEWSWCFWEWNRGSPAYDTETFTVQPQHLCFKCLGYEANTGIESLRDWELEA